MLQHMSLQTRFMVYVIMLLIVLVVLILFVIEHRERIAIFEEQKSKGVLIAKNIAQLNLQAFIQWDEEGIEKNIEEQIDQKLIYVIFYGRFNNPFVASRFIKDYEEIYGYSRLGEDVDEESCLFETKKLLDRNSGEVMRILEIEVPIFVPRSQRRWGSIKIGLSMKDMLAENRKTRLMMVLIGCGGLMIGILGATLLAKRITDPIKKLVDGTVKISKGDFSQKIDIDSQDEIGNLAWSFNEMSRQLQLAKKRMEVASKKLIQAEKLASIGRVSASIAHEIRNPLTSVKLNIQKLLEGNRLDKIERDHLDISQEGIGQIENFIKEMLNFTRVSELNLNRFSIEQIMDESIKMMADSLELKKAVLGKDYQEGLPQLWVDGDRLRQVFLNILRNACEAIDEEGKINISISLLEERLGKSIRIEIFDDGCGIPEKDWENIFEPFYTTKSSGIGLGLANARKIVEQHKGSIRIKKKEGRGANFDIIIPCEEEK